MYKHTLYFANIIIPQVSLVISVGKCISFGHFPLMFHLILFIGMLYMCTGLEERLFKLNSNFDYFKARIEVFKVNSDSTVLFKK